MYSNFKIGFLKIFGLDYRGLFRGLYVLSRFFQKYQILINNYKKYILI